jgi:hypothetical protein
MSRPTSRMRARNRYISNRSIKGSLDHKDGNAKNTHVDTNPKNPAPGNPHTWRSLTSYGRLIPAAQFQV